MTAQPTTWAIQRQRAYELFGGSSPSNRDEADIAEAFALHPAEIVAKITQLGDAYTAGKVHTPWRALHSSLTKLTADHTNVDLSTDRRVHLAENWIRNAGHYCPADHEDAETPTSAEVTHELFHATSALLAGLEHQFGERMQALWRHERGRGIQADTDKAERAARNAAAYHARFDKPRSTPAAVPDLAWLDTLPPPDE